MRRGAGLIGAALLALLAPAAVAGATTIGPSSHDYGSQNVGSSSSPTTFTLTTSGNVCYFYDPGLMMCVVPSTYSTDTTALGGGPGTTITSGDFTIHNLTCPYPREAPPLSTTPGSGPSVSCQFEASFVPIAGGTRSLTLGFPESGTSAPGGLMLIGTGIAPATTSTPTPAPHRKCRKHRHAVAAKRCKKHH